MRRDVSANVTAICALLSFAYTSKFLERHSLSGRPRLSSVLILLLSGGLCFLTSLFSRWLPGAQGRFDSQQRGVQYAPLPNTSGMKSSPVQMPPRPRRLSLPTLVLCIAIRLEIFHYVNHHQECSTTGVESFLCVLLWAYETLSNSRKMAMVVPRDLDDPWRSIFTDISEWLSEPRQVLIMSGIASLIFSLGTYLAIGQVTKSTYFCFSATDSRPRTISLQFAGLALDALIVILFWRMLAWSRTTKLKLEALGSTLVLSSVSITLLWMGHRMFHGARSLEVAFDSLYGFDLVVDSIAFATLAMSSTLWVCDSAIVVPSTVLTVLVGICATLSNVQQLGTWEKLSRSQVLLPPTLIFCGFTWFSYTSDIKTFVFLRRIHVSILLASFLATITIYSMARHAPSFERHPLKDLIIKGNIEESRWLRWVKTSHDLPIALQVYRDRHEGRNPPPYFHEWYRLAKDTAVVDEFRQIDRDLSPFRKVSPKHLRQRVNIIARAPGVATITIKSSGQVSHSDAGDKGRNIELDRLVEIISKFAQYLPDMVLPMNLGPSPRVLPSWHEAHSTAGFDLSTVVGLLQPRVSAKNSNAGGGSNEMQEATPWPLVSARDLQDMHLAACPPASRSRTSPHWRISDFCFACARRHSKGPIMTEWDKSLEICYQPDIYHLHSFFMTNPEAPILNELLPLFSPSKMDGFSDIVFPLAGSIDSQSDIGMPLSDRKNELFWRGKVGGQRASPQVLRGSQKLRLMHTVTQPESDDEVTMVLPFSEGEAQDNAGEPQEEKEAFGYARVSAKKANEAAPLNLQWQQASTCRDPVCTMAEKAFPLTASPASTEALEHRYILLTDEDNGPPLGVIGVLKSKSIPFLSTTFRTWYTERLLPWLHFVPIDTRYQSLHTTVAYFTGTEGQAVVSGTTRDMKARLDEAQWISSQGQKWAEKALGQKDLEVYLFRLLLEWGRLIDDGRDKIGFWQDSQGEMQSSGWTPAQEEGTTS